MFSHRLASVAGIGAGSTGLFTVPAGELWIVKSVSLRVQGAAGNHVYLADSAAGGVIAHYVAVANDDTWQLSTFTVFEAGVTFSAVVVAGAWDLTVSGYKLTLG